MNGKKAKQIRRYVSRISESKNDANYKRVETIDKSQGIKLADIRLLKNTSAKRLEKMLKRLYKKIPWTQRHNLIAFLEMYSS